MYDSTQASKATLAYFNWLGTESVMVQHMLRTYMRETHDLCRAGLCKTLEEIDVEQKGSEKKEDEEPEEEHLPYNLSDSEDETMESKQNDSEIMEEKDEKDKAQDCEPNPFYYGADYIAGTTSFEPVIGSPNFLRKDVFDFLFPPKSRECLLTYFHPCLPFVDRSHKTQNNKKQL